MSEAAKAVNAERPDAGPGDAVEPAPRPILGTRAEEDPVGTRLSRTSKIGI
jgi:hypothetical protein